MRMDFKGTASEVWTIGHSRHEFQQFLELMEKFNIESVVDVRTFPSSKMAPHFNDVLLKRTLKDSGMNYVFMGKELGGRPDGEHMYDEKGHVLYNKLADSELFLQGMARLLSGIERYRVAIMCSEGKPEGCHRHLLIARVLSNQGINVTNILPDGTTNSYKDLAPENRQSVLFEIEGGEPWKSVLSVRQVSQLNDSF